MLVMEDAKRNRQPGDLILDRYMAGATAKEREAARENLRAFAVVVVGMARRLAIEEREQVIREIGRNTVDSEERLKPHP